MCCTLLPSAGSQPLCRGRKDRRIPRFNLNELDLTDIAESQSGHASPQRDPIDAQLAGYCTAIVAVLLQQVDEQIFFFLAVVLAACGGGALLHPLDKILGKIRQLDLASVGADTGVFHDIAQLAHIAGPGIIQEHPIQIPTSGLKAVEGRIAHPNRGNWDNILT